MFPELGVLLEKIRSFALRAISKHAKPSKIYDLFWRCLADNGDRSTKPSDPTASTRSHSCNSLSKTMDQSFPVTPR